MSRYRLAPAAEVDLDDIWHYLATEAGEETADRVIDAITDRFALLAERPEIGRMRHDLELDVRSLPVGSYVIYYQTARREVLIARVLHGRRDQAAAWDK
jgi:toxin ParE1/3/4